MDCFPFPSLHIPPPSSTADSAPILLPIRHSPTLPAAGPAASSAGPRKPTSRPGPAQQPVPTIPEPARTLRFVVLESPDQARTPSARRIVRSAAARDAHARARRERAARLGGNAAALPGRQKPHTRANVVGGGGAAAGSSGEQRQEGSREGERESQNEGEDDGFVDIGAEVGRTKVDNARLEWEEEARLGPLVRGGQVALAGTRPISLLGAGRVDPFQSMALDVTRFEMWLFDYYVKDMIINPPRYCVHFSDRPDVYRREMLHKWVPLAITDQGLLNGVLLAACRSLSRLYQRDDDAEGLANRNAYAQLALRYKGKCMRSLRTAMGGEKDRTSDQTIAKVLMLATDEFLTGEIVTSRDHVDAAAKMVMLNRGESQGLDGFLLEMVTRYQREPALEQGLAMRERIIEENL